MRVTIVAPAENERSARQCRLFTACGHTCLLYLQEQSPAQSSAGTALTPAAFLALDHVQGTALFLFHYVDKPYALLEAMCHLRRGLVALDLCGAATLEQAPVHYADLVLVADAAQKYGLREATGYVPERIRILPTGQDYEQALEEMLEQAMRGISPQLSEAETTMGVGLSILPDGELATTLLIRDPALDRAAILKRVCQGIQDRLAAGGYGPDVATLGPEALRPGLSGDEDADQIDTLLLRFQVALDELAARSRLHEPVFHSDVPVVGSLIVAVRRFWNWMSTKWYVRGWMAQQADFNAQVADVVGQLAQIQEGNEQRIHELELRLAQLEDKENTP